MFVLNLKKFPQSVLEIQRIWLMYARISMHAVGVFFYTSPFWESHYLIFKSWCHYQFRSISDLKRFSIQNQLLTAQREKGEFLSVSCYSMLCAKPFNGVPLSLNHKSGCCTALSIKFCLLKT